MDSQEDRPTCRYCFEGQSPEAGPLSSPCNCSGGQKYVHLSCLRRWQRRVLISQPTHPDLQRGDTRHLQCNVCLSEYTCQPPSRAELIESFTGPELAALIQEGCVIGSHQEFSRALREQLSRDTGSSDSDSDEDEMALHWIDGVYLITAVEEDKDSRITIPVQDASRLEWLRARINPDLGLAVKGQAMRVLRAGSLEEAAGDLREALFALEAPCRLVVAPTERRTCADDHVQAVNLTRPITSPPCPEDVAMALEEVEEDHPGVLQAVEVTHYAGGPCRDTKLATCIVLGGEEPCCGWTMVKRLGDAVRLAHSLGQAGRQLGGSLSGQAGERRVTAASSSLEEPVQGSGAEDDGCKRAAVYAFWGCARWSREQLLGEIARGSWGLCRASLPLLEALPGERRRTLSGELAFAPVTEMSDDYIRNAREQMDVYMAEATRVEARDGRRAAF